MQIPPAMAIEGGCDQLDKQNPDVLRKEREELASAIGQDVATKFAIGFPLTVEFITGYMLGLETARFMVQSSAALALKGVNPDDVF